MPCRETILTELKDLVNQVGCSPCDAPAQCAPCCSPPSLPATWFPYAQVTMTCPPPIMLPTRPEPVKPLQIYCPKEKKLTMTLEERLYTRYDSYYNNYNLEYRNDTPLAKCLNRTEYVCSPRKRIGVTVDGKSPCCEEYYRNKPDDCPLPGCPTGFKPCTMKLTPPPCCDPRGVWCAEIQPCPPKPRVKHFPIPGDDPAGCPSC